MLLGRNWVVWQRRGKISSTNSKSTKACAVASYTFQSNPLAFQQSEYLFSLVCLSFFYPLWVSILIHFLILSFILFFFFRSIRIVSVCAHFLSCFFALKQHLNRLLRFKYLFIQTIFLFWPAIQAGVWLCRFFSLPSETLATLHVDDDDSIVAFALSQTL